MESQARFFSRLTCFSGISKKRPDHISRSISGIQKKRRFSLPTTKRPLVAFLSSTFSQSLGGGVVDVNAGVFFCEFFRSRMYHWKLRNNSDQWVITPIYPIYNPRHPNTSSEGALDASLGSKCFLRRCFFMSKVSR